MTGVNANLRLMLNSCVRAKSLFERIDVPRAVVTHAVDEERRRAVDAASDAAQKILAHPRRMRVRSQLALNARLI